MTDHIDVPILANGDWIDAAWLNEYLGDNIRAFRQGFVNAGGIPYAIDGNTIGELAKPSVPSVLTNDSDGVPEYLAIDALAKGLHAIAFGAYNAGDQNITSTSYVDITNATLNIVTTKTCTIVLLAFGVFAVGTEGERAYVQAVIDGTGSGDGGAVHTSSAVYVPFNTVYRKTSVGAGTITCKLQARGNGAGNNGIFERGQILVLAFEE